MNMILLPGKSSKNKVWIEKIETSFKTHYPLTFTLDYSHWETENGDLNFELELEKLKNLAKEKDEIVIFAKSAGAILAMKAIFDKDIKPTACIFAGTAVGWAQATQENFDSWLQDYSVPTLFIQKTSDPAIAAEDLNELLTDSNAQNYKLLEIPGDNHDYEDINLLVNSSLEFMNKLTL